MQLEIDVLSNISIFSCKHIFRRQWWASPLSKQRLGVTLQGRCQPHAKWLYYFVKRSDTVGKVGIGRLFAAVMASLDHFLPVLDTCRAMSG